MAQQLIPQQGEWTIYHHFMWFWCRSCFRVYMVLPLAKSHRSIYGAFMLWLLGYAGAYANTSRTTFYLCRFFYRSDVDHQMAWARHSSLARGTGE